MSIGPIWHSFTQNLIAQALLNPTTVNYFFTVIFNSGKSTKGGLIGPVVFFNCSYSWYSSEHDLNQYVTFLITSQAANLIIIIIIITPHFLQPQAMWLVVSWTPVRPETSQVLLPLECIPILSLPPVPYSQSPSTSLLPCTCCQQTSHLPPPLFTQPCYWRIAGSWKDSMNLWPLYWWPIKINGLIFHEHVSWALLWLTHKEEEWWITGTIIIIPSPYGWKYQGISKDISRKIPGYPRKFELHQVRMVPRINA